jgi:hypothetical protein
MEFYQGDRVRLTIEGIVESTDGQDGIYIHGNWYQPSGYTDVEVIAAVERPENDAEGTWRSDDVNGTLFRKNGLGVWISSASGERYDNRKMWETTVVEVGVYPPDATVPEVASQLTTDSPEPSRNLMLVDDDGDLWGFSYSTLRWYIRKARGARLSLPTQDDNGYSWEEMVLHPHWFPMRAFTE